MSYAAISEDRRSGTDAAREILKTTHQRMEKTSNGKISYDQFYPLDLQFIAQEVLGWNVEFVENVGFGVGYGLGLTPIGGACDFSSKTIRISVDKIRESERNFTLAHEIGHVVMHHSSPRCLDVFSLRPRSVLSKHLINPNPQEQKMEREANTFAASLLMPAKAVARYFENIFQIGSLYFDSPTCRASVSASQPGGQGADAYNVARVLSTVKRDPSQRCLTEIFSVSQSAMARRLLELRLVY